ncbi:MAG: ferredoxin family protein [Gammaproteobacteria bacterium]|nr:ferredoxin family protein [Gammaproteobacteria bacterium]
MTFVVTENCIACKYTDCVDSCPVDCFHAGENMLVINPDICIDCGVCVPECPADAICGDKDPGAESWIAFNKKYAQTWPIIYNTTEPLPEADAMEGVSEKLKTYFSEQPAA